MIQFHPNQGIKLYSFVFAQKSVRACHNKHSGVVIKNSESVSLDAKLAHTPECRMSHQHFFFFLIIFQDMCDKKKKRNVTLS